MNNLWRMWVLCCIGCLFVAGGVARGVGEPIGEPGSYAVYGYKTAGSIPGSVVERLMVSLGEVTRVNGGECQWYRLEAYKANGEEFRVWLLVDAFPPEMLADAQKATARYMLQEGDLEPVEYVDRFTGEALLPCLGFWKYQIPRAEGVEDGKGQFPTSVKYLGLPMELERTGKGQVFSIPVSVRLELLPDVQVGCKETRRDKRVKRCFDGKGYELVEFERNDYPERFEAGQTVFYIPESHQDLVVRRDVFYQDTSTKSLKYPDSLYRSNYLGVGLDYLDEPAIVTASVIISQTGKDPELKKTMTPQQAFETLKTVFHGAGYQGPPVSLLKQLSERDDVDIGDMSLHQQNMWTWENYQIESAAYQLSEERDGPPCGIVYQGRLCSGRHLPLLDSRAGIQIPTNDLKALLDVYYGLLRGAARVTGKKWGTSIYAQFNVGEIHYALKYAYDLGASYFLFWTIDKGVSHIPYLEQLAHSRFVRDYAEANPDRDMDALRRAAEVIILFPPGYMLLEDPMWSEPALNLERKNGYGVKYRDIIHALGSEIERCYRLGVCYDLAWDLDGLDLSGYREVVRIREDGATEVASGGKAEVFSEPRPVSRPGGDPPQLTVRLSAAEGSAPLWVTVTAEVKEGSALVYFTPSYDDTGVWLNQKVIWELYGPEEWDYRDFTRKKTPTFPDLTFRLDKPGTYRLRASVVDRAGRSAVAWSEIKVR